MSSPKEDRVAKFKRHVEALNKQFANWCSSQVEAKPTSLLATGLSDYLRHAAKLRLEYADIISEEDDKGSEQTLNGRNYAPLLTLMPLCYTKTLHFIRHGEGWHNVGLANADAHLTPKGWQQAHSLGRHMQNFDTTRNVQLIIISPLMRALETAAGVFGVEESDGSAGVLMVAQSEVPDVRAPHAALRQRPTIRYVSNELCRERLGPSSCDSRRPLSEASAAFPGVDFSLIDSDKDPHWHAGNVEPEEAVVLRGRQFLQWLMSLPETNIAIVTHSAFLWFSLSLFGMENTRPVRERLQRWYENCEMRSVVLGDGGAPSVVAAFDSDFRGGYAAAEPQQALMDAEGGARANPRRPQGNGKHS